MIAFARVVDAGSFTAAARQLELPKSTVSRKVAELEASLDARLLHRTTRTLGLTEAGRALYPHAARIAAEAESASIAVSRLRETPSGLLRVTCPLDMRFLGPIAARFMARYPEIQLELIGSDRRVDLIEEGFDVALRAGELDDSSLIARPLVRWTRLVVASDAYRERRGLPGAPEALGGHDFLLFGARPEQRRVTLVSEARTAAVMIRPRLICNDLDAIRDAALAGLGLALLPVFRCGDGGDGSLFDALPGWRTPAISLHALYPTRRHVAPAVTAFVDHLIEELPSMPWAL